MVEVEVLLVAVVEADSGNSVADPVADVGRASATQTHVARSEQRQVAITDLLQDRLRQPTHCRRTATTALLNGCGKCNAVTVVKTNPESIERSHVRLHHHDKVVNLVLKSQNIYTCAPLQCFEVMTFDV